MKLYSTDCPRCRVLIKKLNMKNVDFELIEDEEEVMKVANEWGIQEVPFAIIDDCLYTFSELVKRF